MTRTLAHALAVLALVAPRAAHADPRADATALFDAAKARVAANDYAGACPLFERSVNLDPQPGAELNLADCYEHVGRVASAWTMYKAAAEAAHRANETTREAFATDHLVALQPRLPRFVVKLAGIAPPNLVIAVNGNPADPSLEVALPIDPGQIVAIAHAPGHQDWSQTFQAVEGQTVSIDVPALAELAKPAPAPAPTTDGTEARHRRHVVGFAVAAGGVAAAIVGAAFGVDASGQWSSAKSLCHGEVTSCNPASVPAAQSDINSARNAALVSTIGFAVGGAAIVAGAIYYLSAPSAERATAMRVTPVAAPGSVGLVLTGGW